MEEASRVRRRSPCTHALVMVVTAGACLRIVDHRIGREIISSTAATAPDPPPFPIREPTAPEGSMAPEASTATSFIHPLAATAPPTSSSKVTVEKEEEKEET